MKTITRNRFKVLAIFAAVAVLFYIGTKERAVVTEGVLEHQSPIAEEAKTINDKTDFYTITAKYPVDARDTGDVMGRYVNGIVASKKEEWRVGGEAYLQEQQITKDFPDRSPMTYELAIAYKKYTSQKLNTVSYVLSAYQYTGGAHGGTNVMTFTFGSQGEIKIEDILNFDDNNNDITLTRLLAKKLTGVLGEYSDESMITTGLGLAYLKADGKTLDTKKCACDGFFFPSNMQNFYVGDNGMTFIMNQYQVAPYAVGMPEVEVSWRELAPFLRKDFDLPLD